MVFKQSFHCCRQDIDFSPFGAMETKIIIITRNGTEIINNRLCANVGGNDFNSTDWPFNWNWRRRGGERPQSFHWGQGNPFRVLFFQFLFGSKLKKCGSSLIAKGKRVGTAKGKPEDTEIMGLSTGRACDSDCHGLMDSLRYQKKTIVRCRSRRTSRGRNGMTSEMYLINERH